MGAPVKIGLKGVTGIILFVTGIVLALTKNITLGFLGVGLLFIANPLIRSIYRSPENRDELVKNLQSSNKWKIAVASGCFLFALICAIFLVKAVK